MSHLRYDVTTHDWVVMAPERSARPHDSRETDVPAAEAHPCPFCISAEPEAESALLRFPDPLDSSGWSVLVLPNKYPALSMHANQDFSEDGRHFQRFEGFGAHEVIIESPDHDKTLALQPVEQVERLLTSLQMRYRALAESGGLRAIILFKNHRSDAGSSLRHPHWQIIATPLVPRLLRQKHAIAMDYFDRSFKCLHQILLREELTNGERVVAGNEGFAAYAPYASHLPFQVRIMPKSFQSSFSRCTPVQLSQLAALLKDVLHRLHVRLGDPAFNLTLVSPPIEDESQDYFQWHIDILPRLFTAAGFELGSGMSINPVLPETAARELRQIAFPKPHEARMNGATAPAATSVRTA